jgi:DNA-binding XRE family transcriptional regulator
MAGKPPITNLALVMREWRLHCEMGVRALGKEIGISKATISRLEAGYVPDAHTFLKLINWLMTANGLSHADDRTMPLSLDVRIKALEQMPHNQWKPKTR